MFRKNNDLNLFAVVGATAVGAMIGVAVGLMFAPKSGDELREQIVSTGMDFVKKAKNKKDEFLDDMEDGIEEIGDFASDLH